MKILCHPTVKVVGATQFFSPGDDFRMAGDTVANDGSKLIALAGKTCYDVFGEDKGRPVWEHVENLIQQRHGSVLEHVNVSFYLAGISRGLSHELVRHRHMSFSQRSTRYVTEEEAAIVLDPYYADLYHRHVLDERPGINEDELKTLASFLTTAEGAIRSYAVTVKMLTERHPDHGSTSPTAIRKWARGKARQLLPHCLETRMVVTGNLRTWRLFLEQRADPAAEAEIRRLAAGIGHELIKMYPNVFFDFDPNTLQPKHSRV